MSYLLAGDIGGTKTSLAIISAEAGPGAPLQEATLPSGAYDSLEALTTEFLQDVEYTVDRACFGVAGPVVGGNATITNLPWVMSETHLAETLNLQRVDLINDLVAVATAVPNLPPEDLHVLNDAQADPTGPIAVFAPGTGLGEAYLVHNGRHYRAYPSEGGHADFAPNDLLEAELWRFLFEKFQGHVSWERVCSGIGIPNIYEFFKSRNPGEEPAWLAAALAEASDITPIIVNAALSKETNPENYCSLCAQTLDLFIALMGAEAGNLALKVLSTGGVYLGGGIPPRILSSIEQGRFMERFLDKGRLSPVLEKTPVYVILNAQAALFGAACYGLEN
ncbi:MAG: glucokinase [Chloroflexota bacterium]